MQATRILPEGYQQAGSVDLQSNKRLLIIFNLVAVVLLVLFGWLFARAAAWLRHGSGVHPLNSVEIDSFLGLVVFVGAIFLLTVIYVFAHEAIHGIFFWIFTKDIPAFAIKWNYAYAAAPAWYIRRNPFLVTTLAPLVVITAIGLLIMAYAPPGWLTATWFVVTMNASGAVGDLLVAVWLITKPASGLVQDRGDAITLFLAK